MSKDIQLSQVIHLSEIQKLIPEVIEFCQCCGGIIIDNDKVPQEYIVDYNDRRIHSAIIICEICGSLICENCAHKIEDTWEVFYLCDNCYTRSKEIVEDIEFLQNKLVKITNHLENSIAELRQNTVIIPTYKTRRIHGNKVIK